MPSMHVPRVGMTATSLTMQTTTAMTPAKTATAPKKKPEPITVVGTITGGVLAWATGWQFVKAAFRRWPDGPVEITIAVREERRRVRQNRAYWLALKQIAKASIEDVCWDKDEWHLYFAQKYNGHVLSDLDPKTGEVTEIRVGLSTAKLNVEDFGVYLEHVLMEAAERYGLVIDFDPKLRSVA